MIHYNKNNKLFIYLLLALFPNNFLYGMKKSKIVSSLFLKQNQFGIKLNQYCKLDETTALFARYFANNSLIQPLSANKNISKPSAKVNCIESFAGSKNEVSSFNNSKNKFCDSDSIVLLDEDPYPNREAFYPKYVRFPMLTNTYVYKEKLADGLSYSYIGLSIDIDLDLVDNKEEICLSESKQVNIDEYFESLNSILRKK